MLSLERAIFLSGCWKIHKNKSVYSSNIYAGGEKNLTQQFGIYKYGSNYGKKTFCVRKKASNELIYIDNEGGIHKG